MASGCFVHSDYIPVTTFPDQLHWWLVETTLKALNPFSFFPQSFLIVVLDCFCKQVETDAVSLVQLGFLHKLSALCFPSRRQDASVAAV